MAINDRSLPRWFEWWSTRGEDDTTILPTYQDDGAPMDWTGCSGRVSIWDLAAPGVDVITLGTTLSQYGGLAYGSNGDAAVQLLSAAKALRVPSPVLPDSRYRFIFYAIFANGTSKPMVTGNLILLPGAS